MTTDLGMKIDEAIAEIDERLAERGAAKAQAIQDTARDTAQEGEGHTVQYLDTETRCWMNWTGGITLAAAHRELADLPDFQDAEAYRIVSDEVADSTAGKPADEPRRCRYCGAEHVAEQGAGVKVHPEHGTCFVCHARRKGWTKGWRRWCAFHAAEDCSSQDELAGFNAAAQANEAGGDRPRANEDVDAFDSLYLTR